MSSHYQAMGTDTDIYWDMGNGDGSPTTGVIDRFKSQTSSGVHVFNLGGGMGVALPLQLAFTTERPPFLTTQEREQLR